MKVIAMKLLNISFKPVLCVLAAMFVIAGSLPFTPVMAAKGDLERVERINPARHLTVTLGKAELVDVSEGLSDVLVADPSLIDVQAVQANRLYIVGLQVGDTNIIALDEAGNILKRIDVHVTYDLMAIQDKVDMLFPGENVTVGSIHDQVLLTGTASTPEVASKISNLVGHYVSDLQDESKTTDELVSNLIDTRGDQQVMLQVKIVEATRSVLRELGVNTDINDPAELVTSTLFGETSPTSFLDSTKALAANSVRGVTQDPLLAGSLFLDTGLNGIGQIGLFLQALEEENLANVLAEPNLTAVSGEEAGFLAGGEFPVPVGRDNVGNIVIEFREFGVSLNFKPVVLSGERISLQMKTEVSSLDFENAVELAGLRVPGLDIRRADTTVEIGSGSSLMIAGLLQSESVKGMKGLPGVSKTPVLGDLVSSDSFERSETELIVIVTPYLVKPYSENKVVEKLPKQRSNPLAQAFASNIRREFDADSDLFSADGAFGYILD